MDDSLLPALARAAGLEKALAQFPDDVRAAFEQARRTAGAVPAPASPVAEPWPPMQAGPDL
jgi:hypothetical protein